MGIPGLLDAEQVVASLPNPVTMVQQESGSLSFKPPGCVASGGRPRPREPGTGRRLAWVASLHVRYVAIPAVVVRVFHRERLASIGWDARKLHADVSARLGWLGIFVMVVPYTMIHFYKFRPEWIAAIVAGGTLGAHGLAFRSFRGGVVVHALVAVTMDALAVHRAGLFCSGSATHGV